MKKKICISIFTVAIAAVAAWSLSQDKSEVVISDVVLTNVEALGENPICPNGCLEPPGSCDCKGTHPYLEAVWEVDE
jgi:hypothetical protein